MAVTASATSPIRRWARAASAGVRAVGGFLANLLGRIVGQLRDFAPAVLSVAVGCQSADSITSSAKPASLAISIPGPKAVELKDAGPVADDAAKPLGQFNITFYYVIGEEEVAPKAVALAPAKPANDNADAADLVGGEELAAAIAPPETTTLYAEGCQPIAEVSKEFASQLELQGTGKLKDGRVLNIWGACSCGHSPCFKVTENQWGTAGSGKPLQPFRTVAVDPKVVKVGSLLYVPLLQGRLMPGRAPWGGFIHDGCVVADDTGGGIDGNQLDLFVGRKAYFLGISGSGGSHSWARHVDVFDGTGVCERKGRQIQRKAASI